MINIFPEASAVYVEVASVLLPADSGQGFTWGRGTHCIGFTLEKAVAPQGTLRTLQRFNVGCVPEQLVDFLVCLVVILVPLIIL